MADGEDREVRIAAIKACPLCPYFMTGGFCERLDGAPVPIGSYIPAFCPLPILRAQRCNPAGDGHEWIADISYPSCSRT